MFGRMEFARNGECFASKNFLIASTVNPTPLHNCAIRRFSPSVGKIASSRLMSSCALYGSKSCLSLSNRDSSADISSSFCWVYWCISRNFSFPCLYYLIGNNKLSSSRNRADSSAAEAHTGTWKASSAAREL